MNLGHSALSADGGRGTVVEGNRIYHCQTGGPYHDTYSTRGLTVRNNYYHDVNTGPFQLLNGVSRTDPYALASLDHVGNTAIATTESPHGLGKDERVIISGAGGADGSLYNGIGRIITAVPARDKFEYTMAGAPSGAAVGAAFGTYDFNGLVTNQHRLASLTRIQGDSGYFAQATSPDLKHGLAVGDWVLISHAGHWDKNHPDYPESSLYNGAFQVTAVIPGSPEKFEYKLPDDPGMDSSDANFVAGYFGRIWQTRHLTIENNVIELGIKPAEFAHPCGLPLYGSHLLAPAYSLGDVVIRGNLIRNVHDTAAPFTRAVELFGCRRAIVERNIIGVDRTPAITHNSSGTVRTFNNLSPAGALIESTSIDSPIPIPATETVTKVRAELEEAMAAALLGS